MPEISGDTLEQLQVTLRQCLKLPHPDRPLTAIVINIRPAAQGRLKRPRSDKLSTLAARVVG